MVSFVYIRRALLTAWSIVLNFLLACLLHTIDLLGTEHISPDHIPDQLSDNEACFTLLRPAPYPSKNNPIIRHRYARFVTLVSKATPISPSPRRAGADRVDRLGSCWELGS